MVAIQVSKSQGVRAVQRAYEQGTGEVIPCAGPFIWAGGVRVDMCRIEDIVHGIKCPDECAACRVIAA